MSSIKNQVCARWGCDKNATYKKPLCYPHWAEWDRWELDECRRCHWLFGLSESLLSELTELGEDMPFVCDTCMMIRVLGSPATKKEIKSRLFELKSKKGLYEEELYDLLNLEEIWESVTVSAPDERPVAPARSQLEHNVRYVYILKIADGSFYVGQTNSLRDRLEEHRQDATKGPNPKLVYFESFFGDRLEVNKRENELSRWNQSAADRRKLRGLIERFREPLRLVDFEA